MPASSSIGDFQMETLIPSPKLLRIRDYVVCSSLSLVQRQNQDSKTVGAKKDYR